MLEWERPSTHDHMTKRTLVLPDFARYFFTLAIVVVLALFAWVISPFFNLMIYASLIVVVFYPLHLLLKKYLKSESLAAFFSMTFVALVVLVPLALFLIFLGQEAVNIYQFLSGKWTGLHVSSLQWEGLQELPWIGAWLEALSLRYGFSSFVYNTNIDLIQIVQDVGRNVATFLVAQSGNIAGAVSTSILYGIIFLVTIFFFFRDGSHFIHRLKVLSPLPENYDTDIEHKLIDTIYAIVLGNFGSSLLQGFVAGIGFYIAGIDNVIFWATMVAFTSLLPYVGGALVWLPIAIGLFVQGNTAMGIFMVLWGVFVVSLVDNLARPMLIGKRAKMHPLLTFLTVLGGIFIFGIKGIIFGPLILSLTITILHIYQLEYREVLED